MSHDGPMPAVERKDRSSRRRPADDTPKKKQYVSRSTYRMMHNKHTPKVRADAAVNAERLFRASLKRGRKAGKRIEHDTAAHERECTRSRDELKKRRDRRRRNRR